MASQKHQISTLTTKNEKLMVSLVASVFDIPESNPSSDKDNDKELKMAANKKNSNLTKTNKKRKSRIGWAAPGE